MRITKLKLVNWKNFRETEMEMEDRVFIVGPNASGKSNLLDAIRFLRDIVKQGGSLQEAVNMRYGVSKIRCLGSRKNSDITIIVKVALHARDPEWRYELTFNQTGGGIQDLRAVIKKEHLTNLKTGNVYIDRPDDSDKQDSYLLEFTHLEQAAVNKNFRQFVEFLNDISYLHLIPQLVRDPNSFQKTTKSEDYFGRDFFKRIQKTNINTRNSYLKKIEHALCTILPNLEKLNYKPDDMGIPHLEGVFRQWRGKGAKQQEELFSDGTLRFIGLFWALQDGTKPILLEEPELSLHTQIIVRLPNVIWKLQKKKTDRRQVFITTHSADLLNNTGIAPEEIFLIQAEKEESRIVPAVFLAEIKDYLLNGLPIGDMVMSRTAPKNISQLDLF